MMTGYKNKPSGWSIRFKGEYFKPKKTCGKQLTLDLGKPTRTLPKVPKPNMS